MSSIVMGMMLGAVVGGGVVVVYTRWLGNYAAQNYPVLTLTVPENAEQDVLFQAWCHANQFVRQPNGVYRKDGGWLTSSTEIRFENNQMHIQEIVRQYLMTFQFALNAPIGLGKPMRLHKIKQLNKLIKHWHIEPVVIVQKPKNQFSD